MGGRAGPLGWAADRLGVRNVTDAVGITKSEYQMDMENAAKRNIDSADQLEAILSAQYERKMGEAAKAYRSMMDERVASLKSLPFITDTATMQGAESMMRSAIGSAQAMGGPSSGLAAALAARATAQSQADLFAKGALARMEEQLAREEMVTNLLKDRELSAAELEFKGLEGRRAIAASKRGVAASMGSVGADLLKHQQASLVNTLKSIGQAAGGFSMSKGGIVEGEPVTVGDSPSNDFVHVLLSPGEMVIPRSVTMKGERAISAFARKLLEKEAVQNEIERQKKAEAKVTKRVTK
jgi:hypothetical protein